MVDVIDAIQHADNPSVAEQVIAMELTALLADVRELLEALPERAWTERVTGALQRLKARVS